jgi:cellulose synthase/poly-beta-1,6-N-acetylglucosamine synthase-like glycosyltransferase
VHGLLGQRKRWINGSFFAFESVKRGLAENSRGDCCLKLQIFYLNVMNMLAFVSPALFLFTIHIAMFAFRDWFFGYVLNNLTST